MVINDKLVLPLEHCYYDIFDAVFEQIGQRQKIAFRMNLQGEISSLAVAMEPRVSEIIFSKR